jgi:hypothetical protein
MKKHTSTVCTMVSAAFRYLHVSVVSTGTAGKATVIFVQYSSWHEYSVRDFTYRSTAKNVTAMFFHNVIEVLIFAGVLKVLLNETPDSAIERQNRRQLVTPPQHRTN